MCDVIQVLIFCFFPKPIFTGFYTIYLYLKVVSGFLQVAYAMTTVIAVKEDDQELTSTPGSLRNWRGRSWRRIIQTYS